MIRIRSRRPTCLKPLPYSFLSPYLPNLYVAWAVSIRDDLPSVKSFSLSSADRAPQTGLGFVKQGWNLLIFPPKQRMESIESSADA